MREPLAAIDTHALASGCGDLGHSQRGVSLIELLVAAVIGIVVLGVVASLYIANRKVFQFQESYSRLQESGRFVMERLGGELRSAGYVGCGSLAAANNIINIDPAKDWWLNTDGTRMLWGYEQGETPPETELKDANATVFGDVLVVKYRSSFNEYPIAAHDPAARAFTLAVEHPLAKGSVLVATDCSRTLFFRMSNDNDDKTSKRVEYVSGDLGSDYDNSATISGNLPLAPGGLISPLVSSAFYVTASNDPLLSPANPCPSTDAAFVRHVLVVRSLSGATDGRLSSPQPLACDVETLQLRYGVDNDSNQSADQLLTAKDIGSNGSLWEKVVSVRVDFLLVNQKPNTAESNVRQCLDYNGGSAPATCPDSASGSSYGYVWQGQGKRSAKVFTSTFSLRNRTL